MSSSISAFSPSASAAADQLPWGSPASTRSLVEGVEVSQPGRPAVVGVRDVGGDACPAVAESEDEVGVDRAECVDRFRDTVRRALALAGSQIRTVLSWLVFGTGWLWIDLAGLSG